MCVGIPARVVVLEPAGPHTATVEVEGVRRDVNTIMVDTEPGAESANGSGGEPAAALAVGDWVLLHVGFAMSKIDENEAQETLAFMRELGSVYDEEVDAFGSESP